MHLPSPHPVLGSIAAVAILVTVVACGSNPASSSPSAAPSSLPVASPDLTPVPGGTEIAPATPSTQTDTDWGRIWDALPPSFPLPPDAVPAETRDGPVTAQFAVGASLEDVATFMQAALEGARYSTESMSNPVEDGTVVIDSVGDTPDCRVETRLTPLSGTTLMTIRFGAACPFG